ncbi:pseudouridine synthase [Sphaerotilus microaerophilus]|uniref:tRNA pseudouridine synthase C n=1 Tax=Sphaerotilus microaerophilus TaxID=2914710 RepID=A0ABM7YG15_9BURK|nr:pseudouridine synthase [Sphaerotilus sp. FB-5]BDI03259.1 tRNA pseudouridine(65) synthase TruC [Sphaerotilus sp. FB-5]
MAYVDLPILWRDAHLIAVHKPSGWLVHRTGLDAGETRFVVQTLRGQLGGQHVWPVHRLDKGTCGVLLLALHAEAARAMGEAFARHAVHKRYLAVVRGWAPAEAEVDHPLRPDDSPPDAPAQPAHSHFTRLARLEHAEASEPRFASTRASLVLAEPRTGRRHQIRRHLKHLAHPILGDATHGKGPLNRWWAERLRLQRLWLHAQALDFTHPLTGEAVALHSGLRWDGAALTLDEGAAADLHHWLAWQAVAGWTPNAGSHSPGPPPAQAAQ